MAHRPLSRASLEISCAKTRKEGIFVKPKERVEVVSAAVYYSDGRGGLVIEQGEKRKAEL